MRELCRTLRVLALSGLVLASCLSLVACEEASSRSDNPARADDDRGEALDPRSLFELEYELLRTGDSDRLWSLLTARVQWECKVAHEAMLAGRWLGQGRPTEEKLLNSTPSQFCGAALNSDREATYQTPTIQSIDESALGLAWVVYGNHGDASQRMMKVHGEWRIDQLLTMTLVSGDVSSPRDGGVLKVKLPSGSRQ